MKRSYTVVQSFNAQSADGEAQCDLEQSGDLLKFDTDARFEWFVDRQTFRRVLRANEGNLNETLLAGPCSGSEGKDFETPVCRPEDRKSLF